MKTEFLLWLLPANHAFFTAYLKCFYPKAKIESCTEFDMAKKYKKMKHPIFITQYNIFKKKPHTKAINKAINKRSDARVFIFGEKGLGRVEKEAIRINDESKDAQFRGWVSYYLGRRDIGRKVFVCIGVRTKTVFGDRPTKKEYKEGNVFVK